MTETSKLLSFLPLRNSSVKIGLLLDSISAIISSSTINTLLSTLDYNLLKFKLFVNNLEPPITTIL